MPHEKTPLLVITNILIVCLLFLITRPALYRRPLSRFKRFSAIILILLFCVFSFWGEDWFGYLSYFERVKAGGEVSMERVYIWIVNHICPNYFYFRIWIWGTALVLLWGIASRLRINKDVLLFFFSSIYMIWFSYARVSLAMALMFYGLSLFSSDTKKSGTIQIIVALVCISISFFLHKSAAFGILIITIVILLRAVDRWAIAVSLIAFPLLILIASDFLSGLIDSMMDIDSEIVTDYLERGEHYLQTENAIHGPGVIIQRVFERLPFYLISYLCLKALYNNELVVCRGIRLFMVSTIMITLVSSVFLFNIGMNTDVVYTRFLRFGIIPACISLTFLSSSGKYSRFVKFIYRFAILGCFYALFYSLYDVYVG